MSKKRKVSLKGYMAWNWDKEEAALDRMSQAGWQLVKGGCFHTVYEKDDTKRYRHKIDFQPELKGNKEKRQRYLELVEADGWSFVGITYNGWVYLKKEVTPESCQEDFKIYSDRESLLGMYRRFKRLSIVLLAALFTLIVVEVALGTLHRDCLFTLCMVLLVGGEAFWLWQGTKKMKGKLEAISEEE